MLKYNRYLKRWAEINGEGNVTGISKSQQDTSMSKANNEKVFIMMCESIQKK